MRLFELSFFINKVKKQWFLEGCKLAWMNIPSYLCNFTLNNVLKWEIHQKLIKNITDFWCKTTHVLFDTLIDVCNNTDCHIFYSVKEGQNNNYSPVLDK